MPDRSCTVADRAAFRIFSPRVPYVLVSYTDLGGGHTTVICIFRETEANNGSVALAFLHEVSNPCPAISCSITGACMDAQEIFFTHIVGQQVIYYPSGFALILATWLLLHEAHWD